MRDKNRPTFPPSFALHVSRSQDEVRGNYGGDDFTALRGYTLKEAITHVYGMNPIRLLVPPSLDGSTRYDFSIVLPAREGWETMKAHIQRGMLDYFNLCATRENRITDVHAITAAEGCTPPPLGDKETEKLRFGFSSSVTFETLHEADAMLGKMKPLSIRALRGISVNGTAKQFCDTLESVLDRPVVNETGLEGYFEWHVEPEGRSGNDFVERLRDQVGLSVAPAKRSVEIIVFDFR